MTGRSNSLNAAVVTVHRKLAALAADYVVTSDLALPDAELRKAANQSIVASAAHTRCTARVFLGDGFWLSTMRSVLTAW